MHAAGRSRILRSKGGFLTLTALHTWRIYIHHSMPHIKGTHQLLQSVLYRPRADRI